MVNSNSSPTVSRYAPEAKSVVYRVAKINPNLGGDVKYVALSPFFEINDNDENPFVDEIIETHSLEDLVREFRRDSDNFGISSDLKPLVVRLTNTGKCLECEIKPLGDEELAKIIGYTPKYESQEYLARH